MNKKTTIEEANKLFDQLNAMWMKVEQKIANIGCLKSFVASDDNVLRVGKHKGKWTVMVSDSDKLIPILDCHLIYRTKYLQKLDYLFSRLHASNADALYALREGVNAASLYFEKSMESDHGT